MSKPPLLNATFAGSCYPDDPAKLLQKFDFALKSAPLPPKKSTEASAYIVPHIDFRVNLGIYAEIYRMISKRRCLPELFVILGVGHQCPHEFSLCPFVFKTTLGNVQTDEFLVQQIQQDCPFPISLSPETFRREHSLEFVIVWLQALRDLYFPGRTFQVLPVLVGGLHQALSTGKLPAQHSEFFHFGQILKKHLLDKNAVLIASIDGCHVGPRFDHAFYGGLKVQKIVRKWEKELWSHCRSDQHDLFFQHAVDIQNAFYFDGLGVLSLVLQHFNLKAMITSRDLWFQESDQSFVTFSGGWFDKLYPAGTQ